MSRHPSARYGWTDIMDYDELYETMCFRYHPAVAAIYADDVLKARIASLKAQDTYRQRQRKAA